MEKDGEQKIDEVVEIEAKIEASITNIFLEGFMVVLGITALYVRNWAEGVGDVLGLFVLLYLGAWIIKGKLFSGVIGLITLPFLIVKKKSIIKKLNSDVK